MSAPPPFFEEIRTRAAARWTQLEADPELAGPWHQLFKQVQSPNHVVSELLQNADDAGATEAWARIEGDSFVFEHNGEDFSADHLASLCRFAYSNKRLLHTIGFRGIGFKSTFSLGDRVELTSPTLSIAFEKQRFTEPVWLDSGLRTDGRTRVRVAIADEARQHEVERNLQQWLRSPVSLLFFKAIRRISIGEEEIHWGSLGPGPAPRTEWMALYEDPDRAFLVVRSDPEPFPEDALAEIRQERMLGDEEIATFPPCKVELVAGAEGRLFVVLPTGVGPALPFAVNAPFIQDPARIQIKDPDLSPTNRWLLRRVGELAVSVMQAWLRAESEGPESKAQAYDLLCDVDREDASLAGRCATLVAEAFEAGLDRRHVLLTDDGRVAAENEAVILPRRLSNVWPIDEAASTFDQKGRPPLSTRISALNCRKLANWNLVEEVSKADVIAVLTKRRVQRPGTWSQLLDLWAYVAPDIIGYSRRNDAEHIGIVPVQGQDVLYPADEVVRLGEKKLLHSDEDWELLSEHLLVMNQNWVRFLAEQRRQAREEGDDQRGEAVDSAFTVLGAAGLGDASDASKVLERVATAFFGVEPPALSQCVQLAQIAARLGAEVGRSFRFVTRDGQIRGPEPELLYDRDGSLSWLLPSAWEERRVLHPAYGHEFRACTAEEWERWIAGGRSGLVEFPPFRTAGGFVGGRSELEEELATRGYTGEVETRYSNPYFYLQDWDFDGDCWSHWETAAREDLRVWTDVAERLLRAGASLLASASSAIIVEEARNGHRRTVVRQGVRPRWALRLSAVECLRDTRDFPRKPPELLRRTPETEPLLDVEPFVQGMLDSEATRPILSLLGVRDAPTGPGQLLERLRALSKTDSPPVHEVEKWYRRLDQLIGTCSTDELQQVRQAFRDERLIFSAEHGWVDSAGAFLAAEEQDVPDAAVIREAVRDLSLWTKVGVADYPTADLAIRWLRDLPSGDSLSPQDGRRVRALLARHPIRVWEECGHWLNLAGEWAPVESLRYALSMQSLVPWSHLHLWVKQRTADLQRLPAEVTGAVPFRDLPPLSGHLEDRLNRPPSGGFAAEPRDWLTVLGRELCRVDLDDEDETVRIRTVAADLAKTRWQPTAQLEVMPYLDGTPAGTVRRAPAAWMNRTLYVEPLPVAKLAKAVAQELGRAFGIPEVADAIKLCFERPADFVREYMEENFSLTSTESPSSPVEVECHEVPHASESIAHQEASEGAAVEDPGAPVEAVSEEPATPAGEFPEDDSDEAARAEGEEGNDRNVRPATKPSRPTLIERFAETKGFLKDGEGRFVHRDGSSIASRSNSPFPWEWRTAAGRVARAIWTKEHCLERSPLDLNAEIWSLIDESPDRYSLVLVNVAGEPIEISGKELRAMTGRGELTLYPATYRLVRRS